MSATGISAQPPPPPPPPPGRLGQPRAAASLRPIVLACGHFCAISGAVRPNSPVVRCVCPCVVPESDPGTNPGAYSARPGKGSNRQWEAAGGLAGCRRAAIGRRQTEAAELLVCSKGHETCTKPSPDCCRLGQPRAAASLRPTRPSCGHFCAITGALTTPVFVACATHCTGIALRKLL